MTLIPTFWMLQAFLAAVLLGDVSLSIKLSIINISEPTRPVCSSRMPSSA